MKKLAIRKRKRKIPNGYSFPTDFIGLASAMMAKILNVHESGIYKGYEIVAVLNFDHNEFLTGEINND